VSRTPTFGVRLLAACLDFVMGMTSAALGVVVCAGVANLRDTTFDARSAALWCVLASFFLHCYWATKRSS
jgi:hypothetical protein